jgi:hypothetical protein
MAPVRIFQVIYDRFNGAEISTNEIYIYKWVKKVENHEFIVLASLIIHKEASDGKIGVVNSPQNFFHIEPGTSQEGRFNPANASVNITLLKCQ